MCLFTVVSGCVYAGFSWCVVSVVYFGFIYSSPCGCYRCVSVVLLLYGLLGTNCFYEGQESDVCVC